MKKIALLVALSMLLLSAMVIPGMAQYDWDVGVQVGDWFLYKGTLVYWESDEVEFPPTYIAYLQTYNESDWIKYTITGISGYVVTFEVLTKWTNGSETTSTLEDDMTSSTTLMVIGANLTNGEEIRPAYSLLDMWAMPARYLNESIMLNTPNGTREMNVLNHTSNIFDQLYHYTYYWDKITGAQVYFEEYATDVLNENQQMFSYRSKFELINSATGVVIPELAGPVMLSALMVITFSIFAHKRKKIRI